MKIIDSEVMSSCGTEHLPEYFKDLEYVSHNKDPYSYIRILGKDEEFYYEVYYTWGTCEMCDHTYDFGEDEWSNYIEESIIKYSKEEFEELNKRRNN